MKLNRPYYPAIWFLLGALVASEPWSWYLDPPEGLAPSLFPSVGAVWRALFFGISFAGFFGYAAGIAVLRSHPPRARSAAIGAVFGLLVVAATQLPLFADADFGPLAPSSGVAGLLAGLAVGFRERRTNYPLERTRAG